MGLFLRQDQGRSELQSKLIADLQQRMHEGSETDQTEVDPNEDYTKDQHETRPAGAIIGLLVVVLIIVVAFVVSR